MRTWNTVRCCVTIILAMLLASCGSSPNSTSAPASSSAAAKTISGVAAAGAPIRGMVYLSDSSYPRKKLSAPIASDGSFSFDATGLTAPCVLKAQGSAGNYYYTLYSLAAASGTANINPLSSLAVRLISSNDPETLYLATGPAKAIEAASSFPAAVAQLRDALKGTLAVFGAADVDFVADKFTANHLGLDLMFDLIGIDIDYGDPAGVLFTDKTTSSPVYSTLRDLLSQKITLTPVTPPLTTGNVLIFPTVPVVNINEDVALSAVVIGTLEQEISWSVAGADSGSISSNGVYTAPGKAGVYSVTATTRPRQSTTQIRQTTIQIQVRSPYASPDPFTIADQTISLAGATAGSVVLSNPVKITGLNPNGYKLSLSDTSPVASEVIVDGNFLLSGPGAPPFPYIKPGQTLLILQTPSPVLGGTSVTTVTLGDYSTTFTTRTVQ